MKSLFKLVLILFAVFGAIMLVARLSGLLSFEDIRGWLEALRGLPPVTIGLAVVALLIVDLFLSVPTLALTMLAGFILGHAGGAASAMIGLLLAGMAGYGLGRRFGGRLLPFLIRDENQRGAAEEAFRQNGFIMILLSRAVPMFPEITACMAGMLHMPFRRYMLALILGSAPYVMIAAYAGSISSVANPGPAIIAAISISGFLWLSWFWHHRRQKLRVPPR